MKKQSILLILFILNMAMTFAQKAYRGTSSYASDIVCNVEKGKVYRGQSRYTSDIIARFDGTNLYRGNSTYSSDIIMTWRDGKIYRGRSSYQSDVLATWRDGKMYSGTSSYQSDILFTYRDNKVYRKNESYQSSILLNSSAPLHPIILYILLTPSYYTYCFTIYNLQEKRKRVFEFFSKCDYITIAKPLKR